AMAALLLLLPLLLLRCSAKDVDVLCADSACYTLHRDESSWKSAQERCRDNGGNLAAVGSAGEAARLRELLATARWSHPAWLGLSLPRGHCVQPQEPLRGFSWVAGGEPGNFSEWASEPAVTCLSARCVALLPSAAGWADRACRSPLPAFLCKFSFQGMCGLLPLAGGGGAVTYSTPFGVRSARLAAAPFGTLAQVQCHGGGGDTAFALCKALPAGGGFGWHPPGPLCPVTCGQQNGGCQQRCLEEPGQAPRCACHPGFVLAGDMASCVPRDSCHPNPCQGSCRALPDGGFECGCEPGYALAADGRGCSDVDECESRPCQHRCRNVPGGFQCHCPPGYRPAGPDGRRCHDVDECAQPQACPQLCINIPGSFRCACRPGFQRQPGGDSCLDVDECLRDPCPGACRNFPGGYECLCPPGSRRDGDGHGCSPGEAIPNSIPESSGTTPQSSSITPPQTSGSSGTAGTGRVPRTTSAPRTPGMPTAGSAAGSEEDGADGPRLLLYYIVGSLVGILLLLALALALVACRKRAAKREKPPAKNAADNYCWVPEQPGERR
ncbi:C1QR1 protein, partial [Chaetops frenatus]|nr:C1QR1 protein [Chaetops frenatus]